MVHLNFDYDVWQHEHADRLERANQARLIRMVKAARQQHAKNNADRLSDRVVMGFRYAFGI